MREIKFRAWDKNKREMREVTSLNFYDEYIWVDETPMTGDRLPLYTTPIMQCTGLKDKNGKEIYEGDIVEIEYTNNTKEISYVEFEQEFCRFALKVNSYDYEELTPETDCLEVIGNIYEHPHLLEQTNDNP